MSETVETTEAGGTEAVAVPSAEAVAASVPTDPAPASPPAGSMPLRPRIPPPGIRVKKEAANKPAADRDRKPRGPRKGAPAGKGGKPTGDRERGPRKPRSQEFKGDDAAEIVTAKVPTDEDKAKRKERVVAAKDALSRSVGVKGPHVAPARAAIKEYLRNLNESRQPSDDKFNLLIEAPFQVPPKPRPLGGQGGGGRR
ncbi:MAG: hypothetical protein WBD02_00295 [Acidimicrobiia bacterium]